MMLMLMLMLAVSQVSVGRNKEVTRKVVVQQVRRDRHAMALRIGRGHGGAI